MPKKSLIHKPLSRRQFLKLTAVAGASAGLARFAPNLAYAQTGIQVAEGAMNPLNMAANVQGEGVFFSGGYGHEYIEYAADIFAEVHEGSTMSVEGIQRVGERLRPRIISGNPPDVIDNSGAGNLDTAALVAEGELLDLAPLMAAPALDTPGKTFEETLFPGSQTSAMFDGTQYALNIAYTVFGVWYSQSLFEENGWTYPTTWAGMLDLSENIKASGMAPWTYQGKFPYYMTWVLEQLVTKNGGPDVWKAVDNLEEDAWNHPAILESLNDMKALYDNDFIMDGTEGLTHTESQAEWLQNKAAFIPSGTWLENEMRSVTPEGFDMVIAAAPGTDESSAAWISAEAGEPFMVFANAENPIAGMEFLRCLLSKKSAAWFAQNVGSIMPVVGGADGIELSSAMASAFSAVDAAGDNIIQRPSFGGWYSDLNTEAANSMGSLLTGRIDADEFVERVQEVADEVKADDDIPKYTRD